MSKDWWQLCRNIKIEDHLRQTTITETKLIKQEGNTVFGQTSLEICLRFLWPRDALELARHKMPERASPKKADYRKGLPSRMNLWVTPLGSGI